MFDKGNAARIAALLGAVLAGCAANAPKAQFALAERGPEAQQDVVDLNRVRMRLESGERDTGQITGQLWDLVTRSPEAAKFVVDSHYGAVAMNANILREISLRTLLRDGQFDYLPEYWKGLEDDARSGRIPAYNLDFALLATTWSAENSRKYSWISYASERLARYWSQGCSGLQYEKGGKWEQNPLQLVGMSACHPRNELTAVNFARLLKVDRLAATRLARELGDFHFTSKRFGEAGGWYVITLNLYTANYNSILAGNLAAEELANRIWPGRQELREILGLPDAATATAQNRDYLIARLRRIEAAGVSTIPPL